jgi:hypothetical protein
MARLNAGGKHLNYTLDTVARETIPAGSPCYQAAATRLQ